MVLVRHIKQAGRHINDYDRINEISQSLLNWFKNYAPSLVLKTYDHTNTSFRIEVRLKEKKRNFDCWLGNGNYVKVDDKHVQNTYFPGHVFTVRQGHYLQESDWMLFNDLINKYFDMHELSATVKSSLLYIRKGKNNIWEDQYERIQEQRDLRAMRLGAGSS